MTLCSGVTVRSKPAHMPQRMYRFGSFFCHMSPLTALSNLCVPPHKPTSISLVNWNLTDIWVYVCYSLCFYSIDAITIGSWPDSTDHFIATWIMTVMWWLHTNSRKNWSHDSNPLLPRDPWKQELERPTCSASFTHPIAVGTSERIVSCRVTILC